ASSVESSSSGKNARPSNATSPRLSNELASSLKSSPTLPSEPSSPSATSSPSAPSVPAAGGSGSKYEPSPPGSGKGMPSSTPLGAACPPDDSPPTWASAGGASSVPHSAASAWTFFMTERSVFQALAAEQL